MLTRDELHEQLEAVESQAEKADEARREMAGAIRALRHLIDLSARKEIAARAADDSAGSLPPAG